MVAIGGMRRCSSGPRHARMDKVKAKVAPVGCRRQDGKTAVRNTASTLSQRPFSSNLIGLGPPPRRARLQGVQARSPITHTPHPSPSPLPSPSPSPLSNEPPSHCPRDMAGLSRGPCGPSDHSRAVSTTTERTEPSFCSTSSEELSCRHGGANRRNPHHCACAWRLSFYPPGSRGVTFLTRYQPLIMPDHA